MSQAAFCPNCGAQVSATKKFCNVCGNPTPASQVLVPQPNVASVPSPFVVNSPAVGATVRMTPSQDALQLPDGSSRALQGTLTIGRASQCDVTLQDMGVSNMHARIEVDTGGRVVLTDLGSTSGTLVNGVLLTAHQPAVLRPGAMIQMANSSLTYMSQRQAAPSPGVCARHW